jgi:ABC-2 type transport system ATP-binding protein
MNAVELESVTHRYGKVQALDGLNLTVRRGEMFGFLGRNGAGKTTTLESVIVYKPWTCLPVDSANKD